MAVTATPVFAQTPNVGAVNLSGGWTKSEGTTTTGIGTDIFKVYTAGTNGSFIEGVLFTQGATAAATNTAATVFRVYLSTKTSGATTGGTDTWLLAEQAAPIQSADHSSAPTAQYFVPIGRKIPSGYTILVSSHVAPAASTAHHAICFAEDY